MKINFNVDINQEIKSTYNPKRKVKNVYKYTSLSILSHFCLVGLLFSSALFAENIIIEEGDNSIKAMMIDLSQIAAPTQSLAEITPQQNDIENNDEPDNDTTAKLSIKPVVEPDTEISENKDENPKPLPKKIIEKKEVVSNKKDVVKKTEKLKNNPPQKTKSSLQQTKQVIDTQNMAQTAVAPSISDNSKFSAQPSPISRNQPEYPRRALDMRLEGHVVARYDVNSDGRVENIRIVESIPNNIFDKSVINAMKKWKYKPVPSKDLTVKVIFNQNKSVSLSG